MNSDQERATKYMRIVQAIKESIEKGTLKPQDPSPGESEMMKSFQVSSITVRKAMEMLAREGVIYRIKGKGSYVADPFNNHLEEVNNKNIYLIFDDVEDLDASLSKIVQGIQKYCKGRNYSLILENSNFYDLFFRRGMEKDKSAGLIVYANSEKSIERLYRLYKHMVNFVCIDRYIGRFPVNYVGTNNHDAMYSAVEYLIDQGHQNIGFLYEKCEQSSERERYAGYADAMQDGGLGNFIAEGHRLSDIDLLLKKIVKREYTAMICANDYTASVLMDQIRSIGLEVPRDISVVGFDDSKAHRDHEQALTTLRQDFLAIGYEAARILDNRIRGITAGHTKIYIPAKLIVRDSVGKNEKLNNN